MEERDGGVEQMACEHGGQGHAEERGGEHHVERGLDEEAGQAGEEAEEGDDAEEGDGGPGGDRGEVEQAVGDLLEELGDVGSTAGGAAGGSKSLLRHRLDPPVSQSQVLVGQKVVPAQVLLVVAAAAEYGLLGWAADQGKPGS